MRIDDYVGELDRALTGPRGAKRDLVVEARDGLVDAADALEAGGLDRAEAERLAVAEFGSLDQVAPGYQAELAITAGRRLGLLLFVGIPVTVLMWSAIWRFYPVDRSAWTGQPASSATLSRALDVIQLLTALYGGLAVLALGRGARWIRRQQAVTRSLGVVVLMLLPATGLMSLALSRDTDALPGFPPATVAGVITLALWAVQVFSATRCLLTARHVRSRATGPWTT